MIQVEVQRWVANNGKSAEFCGEPVMYEEEIVWEEPCGTEVESSTQHAKSTSGDATPHFSKQTSASWSNGKSEMLQQDALLWRLSQSLLSSSRKTLSLQSHCNQLQRTVSWESNRLVFKAGFCLKASDFSSDIKQNAAFFLRRELSEPWQQCDSPIPQTTDSERPLTSRSYYSAEHENEPNDEECKDARRKNGCFPFFGKFG